MLNNNFAFEVQNLARKLFSSVGKEEDYYYSATTLHSGAYKILQGVTEQSKKPEPMLLK